jgi:hypothetical protein
MQEVWIVMKKYPGVVSGNLTKLFKSERETDTLYTWLRNFSGIEQLLAVSGLLDPDFYEINGRLFWNIDRAQGKKNNWDYQTPYGKEPAMHQKYENLFNVSELFWYATHVEEGSLEQKIRDSDDDDGLVIKMAEVIQHFWQQALQRRFPERTFQFAIEKDTADENGYTLTFWEP